MCIFCEIVNKKKESFKIYEDEDLYAFLDLSPVSAGHTLIIPKKHHENFLELPKESLEKILDLSRRLYLVYKKALNIEGLSFAQNNELGQEVLHYHLHLIPRYKRDPINKLDFEKIQSLILGGLNEE